jgi:hypothetical protein
VKVDRALLNHPKFRRLHRVVGDRALMFLVRIWGHCEDQRRGEVWKGADFEYLEMVAEWDGEPNGLAHPLVSCGFVDDTKHGLTIHDWNNHNSLTVRCWNNGDKGGRPHANPKQTVSKPTGNPTLQPPETHCEPPNLTYPNLTSVEGGAGGNGAEHHVAGVEIPDDSKVIDWATRWTGDMARGIPARIPEDYVLRWIAWRKDGSTPWPRDWQDDLTRRYRADWVADRHGLKSKSLGIAKTAGAQNSPPVWKQIQQAQADMDAIARGRTKAMMKEDGDLDAWLAAEARLMELQSIGGAA